MQAFTEAGAPSNGDGLVLNGVDSVMPVLIAPQGETFTGAGSLLGWYQNDTYFDPSASWDRFPRADDTDLSDFAGRSIIYLPGLPITHPAGRLVLLANGIGHSGAGTSFVLKLLGLTRKAP